MRTEDLIQTLSDTAKPVRRLAHPVWRAALWVAVSLAYFSIVLMIVGVREDLATKVDDPRYLIEVGAALLTSIMAAAAAFCAGCPGRPLWERFAPFPFLAVWLASLGEGCWRQWVQTGPDGQLQFDFLCVQVIFALSLLPALLIMAMIKRGAPIAPMSTTGLATLAATALSAAVLRLFHAQDASLMLLVWQFGSVLLLAGLGFLLGRVFLRWSAPALPLGDG
jgi:hypothetical protein